MVKNKGREVNLALYFFVQISGQKVVKKWAEKWANYRTKCSIKKNFEKLARKSGQLATFFKKLDAPKL